MFFEKRQRLSPFGGAGRELLYNMNGRLYDPLVGRFLSADPYVQDGGLTQSYNRYSYCLNNPLRYTDPTGEKIKWPKFEWRYLIPVLGQLDYVMQTINDNTEKLRNNMSKAGIPPFGVGVNVNLDGNVNANANVNGHEVFNTANKDRSNAEQVVNKEIAQVRQDYGSAWHAASGGSLFTASTIFGSTGVAGDIASMSNSTFRLTNGVVNGSMLSPKIYGSGWNGGSAADITTYSLSKAGIAVSFGAGVVTTAMAYNEIYNGSPQSITFIDAGVGTVGVMSSLASYYSGIQIPYVGEGVAVYGTLRLTWDVFYNLGANYGPVGAYYGINKWSGR